MVRKRQWLIMVVMMLLLTACAQQGAVEEGYFPGNKAFDFTLENLSGETVNLSDYSGKSILLVFWASW